jgi:hypothetical protein
MQSESGAALTEPENKISQYHTGSRAGVEKFQRHSNVTECNFALCMTSNFTESDSIQKSNKVLPSFLLLGPREHLFPIDFIFLFSLQRKQRK